MKFARRHHAGERRHAREGVAGAGVGSVGRALDGEHHLALRRSGMDLEPIEAAQRLQHRRERARLHVDDEAADVDVHRALSVVLVGGPRAEVHKLRLRRGAVLELGQDLVRCRMPSVPLALPTWPPQPPCPGRRASALAAAGRSATDTVEA